MSDQAAEQVDYPRTFVSNNADLGDPAQVEAYYRQLDGRSLNSPAALEAWLRDWSELEGWLGEEGSVRHVEMTCQTDDPVREKRFLDFIENVVPPAKTWSNKLEKRLLACEHRTALPRERYAVLLRNVENRVSLFREENVALQVEDEKLRQQYQKLVGGLTATHDGREQTMQQLAQYLERTDRKEREAVWHKISSAWAGIREDVERIYDEMVRLRHEMARNAGFENYRDYAFLEHARFDYTPADCVTFADSIAQIIVPATRSLADRRKAQLGVDRLRPWDMAVDPEGREPLRPFEGAARLVEGSARVFEHVHPVFGEQFDRMRAAGLLDLESRKGKAPGGYMMNYEGRRLPFIFMNAVGTQRDLETLLHEGGHAFHAFATRNDPLVEYRSAPTEFSEVASMAMELLALPHLGEFYSPTDRDRSESDHLDGIIRFFPYMAKIDQLQHWVYTHPRHTRDERRAVWEALEARFEGWVDFAGIEGDRAWAWHRKTHPFTVPFYYVEYGIAQLGALGVWLNSRRDYPAAVSAYRRGLGLGGTRPLPELFRAAGVAFDFSTRSIEPAIGAAHSRMMELS